MSKILELKVEGGSTQMMLTVDIMTIGWRAENVLTRFENVGWASFWRVADWTDADTQLLRESATDAGVVLGVEVFEG